MERLEKKTSQQHHAPRYPTHKDWVHSCSHSRLTHRYCFLRKCQQVKLANEMHKTLKQIKDCKISDLFVEDYIQEIRWTVELMQPQVWSAGADLLWYEKCIKIQIMSNWTTIQFAQLPISIFVNNMLQHVSTCWKQGWIIMNYINIRKWHAIKQVHKQVSSGNVTAVSVALCTGAGAGVCSSARMNAHDCTKEKVVHNDTTCI